MSTTSVVTVSDVVCSATSGDSLGGSSLIEPGHSEVTSPAQSGPGCAPGHFPIDSYSHWLKVGDRVEALTKGKFPTVRTVAVDSLPL